jgi:UDP-N-acetylmuramyl pentapeptide phosphotransferase/UDP-N-acetylglucosamine-1-phosphate transferase
LDITILIGLSALALSAFLNFILNKFFLSKNIIDKVNTRSSHSEVATRSGGVAIFSTLFLISLYFYLTGYDIYQFSLLVPLSVLLTVGLYDDINGIDFKLKFIFQIIAAKILIDNGLVIDNLHGFAGIYELNRLISQLLTIFIILAILNSINFIDGLDGLAASVLIFFILGFEFYGISTTPYTNLSNILVMSLLPLYYFNFRKSNKIFLGDSGSLFLGGIASIYIVHILSNNYIIKPQYDLHKIIFVFTLLAYPITDLIRVVVIRLLAGYSPFIADKNHIHHILLKRFKKHIYVVLFIVFATILILSIAQFFLG